MSSFVFETNLFVGYVNFECSFFNPKLICVRVILCYNAILFIECRRAFLDIFFWYILLYFDLYLIHNSKFFRHFYFFEISAFSFVRIAFAFFLSLVAVAFSRVFWPLHHYIIKTADRCQNTALKQVI